MNNQTYEELGQGITRIDSGMIRSGLAACYLMQSGDRCALIETGTHNTIPTIMALLAQKAIEPEQVQYIIPTHVHLDHAGGVGGLMQLLPAATLLIHPSGARHMINPEKLKAGATAVYGEEKFKAIYGDVIAVEENRVQVMQDGDQVELSGRQLIFYDTPGHARHHFCVHDMQSNGIFTGDTFGIAYPELATEKGSFIFPTTTPVQFDPVALKESIGKLLKTKPERMYLTHYGVVQNPQLLSQSLLQQIDDYVMLARSTYESSDQASLEVDLIERLSQYTVQRAREHGCQLSETNLMDVLEMDMRLNAQGLVVWLQS